MTDEQKTNTISSKKQRSTFGKILLWLYRVLAGALVTVLLLLVVIIGITQISAFRNYVKEYVLDMVNSSLLATIEIDDFSVNPFSGISVQGFRLLCGGDTLVYAPELTADPDFWMLLDSKANLRMINISSARVKLLRGSDSLWNFEKISVPSDDSSGFIPFDFKISIKNLMLSNTELTVMDSLSIEDNEQNANINFTNLKLNNLNLFANVEIDFNIPQFNLNVNSLKFFEENNQIAVEDIKFSALADTSVLSLQDFMLQTPDSKIRLSASVSEINFLAPDFSERISKVPIELDMEASINKSDVRKFVALNSFIPAETDIEAKFSGKIDDFSIDVFTVAAEGNRFELNGMISQITDSSKTDYNLFLGGSEFSKDKLADILPTDIIAYIPDFGTLSLKTANIHGNMTKIYWDIAVESGLGKIFTDGILDFENGYEYSANLKTTDLNPGKIINDAAFAGNINSEMRIVGKGFEPETATAELVFASHNSTMYDISYQKLELEAKYSTGGILQIDTLKLLVAEGFIPQGEFSYFDSRNSELFLSGGLDIRNLDAPRFSLIADFKNLDLKKMLKIDILPELFGGKINTEASGLHPDSLAGTFDANIEQLAFDDRAFLPFDIKAALKRESQFKREFTLNSQFADIILEGEFSFSSLIKSLDTQIELISGFVQEKIYAFDFRDSSDVSRDTSTTKIIAFEPLNLNLHADIKNISPVNTFIDESFIHAVATLDLSYNVSLTESSLILDSLALRTLQIEADEMTLSIRPVNIQSEINTEITDSVLSFSKFDLKILGSDKIIINENVIDKPQLTFLYSDNHIEFSASTTFNKELEFAAGGSADFIGNGVSLAVEKLDIGYMELFKWKLDDLIRADLDGRGVKFNTMSIIREEAERINISGEFREGRFTDFIISIRDFPFASAENFVEMDEPSATTNISGKLDSLVLTVNGTLEAPDLSLRFGTNGITYDKMLLGNIIGSMDYRGSVLSGKINLFNEQAPKRPDIFTADIKSMPLVLNLAKGKAEIAVDKQVDLSLQCNEFPLAVASPFISAVSDLNGFLRAKINISGTIPADIDYSGNISFVNTSFLLHPNNLRYSSFGDIAINRDKVTINNIVLKNSDDDYSDGKANMYGEILLDDFSLSGFDISVKSDGIKILGNASRASMPSVFGDFVIATGQRPLNLSGSLDAPSVSGDLNIILSELTMPNRTGTKTVESSVIYEIKGDTVRFSSIDNALGTDQQTDDERKPKSNFAKALALDIDIKIFRPLEVTMELGTLAELNAVISTANKMIPIRIYQRSGANAPEIRGELVVQQGSVLKLFSLEFKTQGTVSFPTGTPDNPELNLTAAYSGKSTLKDKKRDYTVTLHITGTRKKPDIRFDYVLDNQHAAGDSSTITQDAIFLLLFGMTSAEFKESSGQGSLGNDLAASGASAAASQFLTGIFRETSFIQSADINFTEGWENARLQLTGKIWGDLGWKIGGTVADFSNNNEIVIDYPIPLLSDTELLNSIIIQASKTTNLANPTPDQKEWEVKVKVGGTW